MVRLIDSYGIAEITMDGVEDGILLEIANRLELRVNTENKDGS